MTVQIFQILAYFNPRSREGSDQNLRWKISAATEISIHAPARGATGARTMETGIYIISIHAPARGATTHGEPGMATAKFQSTLPRGERRYSGLEEYADKGDFNPRSREGSDLVQVILLTQLIKFQSTLPRGERLTELAELSRTLRISIHAPARGATAFPCMLSHSHTISIHAPARGATFPSLFF